MGSSRRHRALGEARMVENTTCLAKPGLSSAFLLWIEKLRKARVFLEEGEVLIIAGVIAVLRTQFDRHLEVGHRRIGFPRQAVQRRKRIVNMIGLGRCL